MSPTDPLRLMIVHFPDGWRILAGRSRCGRFDFWVDAEEAAIRIARRWRRTGRAASILVQDRCGRLEGLAGS
jgi:hypothetical protein